MATHELRILGREGDTKITWDKNNADSRAKAREEVTRLKSAGFLFFLVDGTPADEVAAGNGELLARIVTAEEVVEEVAPEASPEVEEQPKRRGRKPKVQQAVAVRAVRGG